MCLKVRKLQITGVKSFVTGACYFVEAKIILKNDLTFDRKWKISKNRNSLPSEKLIKPFSASQTLQPNKLGCLYLSVTSKFAFMFTGNARS
jgi:hypothetical protein